MDRLTYPALNLPAESHFTQMGGAHYLNKGI